MRCVTLGLAIFFLAGCGGGSPTSMTPPLPSPAATPAADPTPAATPTAPPPAAEAVVRSAALRGANGHAASGNADIVRRGESFALELRRNFRIDSGFNDVYLTREPGGISAGDLNLGDLRATSGAQSYAMPHDGGGYGYVLLWCRPFRVPIALGELR